MQYNESTYANYESLPVESLTIFMTNGRTEEVLARALPDGNYMLDSIPRDERFRWQDIVTTCNPHRWLVGWRVHRRWNTKIPYSSRPDTHEEWMRVNNALTQAGFNVCPYVPEGGHCLLSRGTDLDTETARARAVVADLSKANNPDTTWS